MLTSHDLGTRATPIPKEELVPGHHLGAGLVREPKKD